MAGTSKTVVRRVLVAGAMAPVMALAVSGCGALEDKAAEKITEKAIEGAAGGDADVDLGDDGLTVTDKDGNKASFGTHLPDDFPVDDVPLLEGKVVTAASVDGSFTVMLEVEGSPDEVQDRALAKLTDAGYTSVTEVNSERYYSSQMSKEGYDVTVTSLDADGTTQLQYVVAVT